jgi:hypothetical protein
MQVAKKILGGVMLLFGIATIARTFSQQLPEGSIPFLLFMAACFFIATGLLLFDVFKNVKVVQDNYTVNAWVLPIIGFVLVGVGARSPKKEPVIPAAKKEVVMPKKDTIAEIKKDTPQTKKVQAGTTSKPKTAKPKPAAEPKVYYSSSSSGLCGARTKKGGSCRNRVKGGGYCSKHGG